MKAFLTVVSICFSFIVAGESLMCQHCINYNGTNCSNNLTTCDANSTSCENRIFETTVDGSTRYVAFKTCSSLPQCQSFFFSQSINDFNARMQLNCCTTDNCNADPIVLPPRNNTPNGVICPFCYAENITTCKPQETMNCTGLETQCVHFAVKKQKFDKIVTEVFRGCITNEPCEGMEFGWPVLEVNHLSCDGGDDDKNKDVNGNNGG